MSFPRYPKYKDSGVEWLGEVPAHWEILPLRRCLLEHRQGYYSESDYVDAGVRMLRITDLRDFGMLDVSTSPLVEDLPELEPYFLRESDFVFARTGGAGTFGLVEKLNEPAVYASYLIRFRFSGKSYPRFLRHVFLSSGFRESVRRAIHGGVNQNIHAEDIKNQYVTLPPLAEQSRIADFLDRETSKIDALVAEQRRLMELLKEKRQAVISHAVTKGLDPSVKLKPSGVEWLGDVPAHWESKQIRFFAGVLRGKFTHRPRNDPAFYDGEYPFIQTGDITGSTRYIMEYKQTLNERGISVSKQFPKGTLVMAIAANIGDVAILDFPAYFPDSIVGLVPKQNVDLMFLYYLTVAMKQPMVMAATVSTQMNLNVDQICSMVAACPPLLEQENIVHFLDTETAKFDALTTEAQRAIDLLQERRTALISAAVTGRIDVRGLAANDA